MCEFCKFWIPGSIFGQHNITQYYFNFHILVCLPPHSNPIMPSVSLSSFLSFSSCPTRSTVFWLLAVRLCLCCVWVCVCVCVCVLLEIEQGGHFFGGEGWRTITDGPCQISVHLALFLSNFFYFQNTHMLLDGVRRCLIPDQIYTSLLISSDSIHACNARTYRAIMNLRPQSLSPHIDTHTDSHTHTQTVCAAGLSGYGLLSWAAGCQSNDARESGPRQL